MGAMSCVSWLNELALVMITDEVLGGGLLHAHISVSTLYLNPSISQYITPVAHGHHVFRDCSPQWSDNTSRALARLGVPEIVMV